jgi:hypothetical protein
MKQSKRWLNFPESFERNGNKALCITVVTGKFPHLEVKYSYAAHSSTYIRKNSSNEQIGSVDSVSVCIREVPGANCGRNRTALTE